MLGFFNWQIKIRYSLANKIQDNFLIGLFWLIWLNVFVFSEKSYDILIIEYVELQHYLNQILSILEILNDINYKSSFIGNHSSYRW